MVWPSLDSLFAITFSWLGMRRALRVTHLLVHQVRILHRRARLHPPFFVYIGTVVLSVAIRTMLSKQHSLGTHLEPERPPLVPDDLCVACFLEETRFPLQCVRLSERPTLLLMRL